MNFKKYFKDKKVTVMGLGLLGRGVGDAEFLARQGVELIVTDLKTEEELALSLERLKKYNDIVFHLGEHKLEDFRGRDFILKAAGVPLDSPFIVEARKNGIPIEMDASLFAKLAPKTTLIGVTGTRGKSTTSALIFEILKHAGRNVFWAGNIKDTATLPLLEEVKAGDIVVMELDSWQLQGFGEAKLSPHIAVFTTFFPDHMNYYGGSMEKYFGDKSNIFKFQKDNDVFVVGSQAFEHMKKGQVPNNVVLADSEDISLAWKLKIPGEHNRYNAACALAAVRALGIADAIAREGIEEFGGVEGRLQFIKETKGVKIYNDTTSTTPDATIAALRAVGDKSLKRIVLIVGGDDKLLDMSGLVTEIPKWCSKVVLFKERGTERIRDDIFALKDKGIEVYEEEGLEETVRRVLSVAVSGEIILYSPAFSSFGKYFKNEFDRGEQFEKIVKNL
ncbi:MAG TPA: UDP-N-acetylmuramoyl-L-alanine--D-glutamate ligase [Candidatus Paceibacterota bacterium]